jgi:positive regulator of sigma E activity
MKIDNLVVGIIVICFAALLLVDAILTTYTPASQILSPNDVKGITGIVFGVIAAFIFVKAFVRTKQ